MKPDYSHLKKHPLIGAESKIEQEMFNYDDLATEPNDFIEEKLTILDEEKIEFPGFYDVPYLAMTGIKKAGESKFKTRTIETPIPPGTYRVSDFALRWPEQYTALTIAGMPRGQSLITITGRNTKT